MGKIIWTFGWVLLLSGMGHAQDILVQGTVLDSDSNEAVPGVSVNIQNTIFTTTTDAYGNFSFSQPEIPIGEQVLRISKAGYKNLLIPIQIQDKIPVDLRSILLKVDLLEIESQIGVISLSDEQLDEDEGTSNTVAGLLQASKDVFLNAAAYDFSATFFRPRGYNSEDGKVLINGLEMNKLYNGRPQWANWGGLNDAQRNQIFSMGLAPNEYTFGDLAGTTNIIMRASQYRRGGRISYASSNRSYRGRVLGFYNSGLTLKGWAYSVLVGRRFGNEGYVDGSIYDANSFFVSVERKFSDTQSLNLTGFYTPNRRGKSSPNTQEVYDLKDTRYNSYWGKQDGEIRNSRIKKVEEPIVMLNHFWNISEKTELNTNLAYQFGKTGNSRLGYDNAPNPDPSYYKKLPSYFLTGEDGANYEAAYSTYENFVNNGQIDWYELYKTNIFYGGTSRYYLYEDRNDDRQFSANTILRSGINENIELNASVNFRRLKSSNFASMIDLLGGAGYLDVDSFNSGEAAQNDLNNPNRIIGAGDTFKYNYELYATDYSAFVQTQFVYRLANFYVAGNLGRTSYQRNGLYRNGSYATENDSFGESEKLNFTSFGAKAGATYKISGRHLVEINSAFFTKAPTVANSFSNSRQNNATVIGLTEEKVANVDASYRYQSPKLRARLTGYYSVMQDASKISFYYADGISVPGRSASTAFVQEVLTDIDTRNLGAELGLEAQITTTLKFKAAAAYGQYTYNNNPNLYLTSDDLAEPQFYGKSYLKNYRLSGGPEQAYQLGFEYRDPGFWWFGATANYFSNAYLSISPLTRTRNFYLDTDGMPFNDYDPEVARRLLKQEKFDNYLLVNIVGGKSWKVKDYYVGFFATVNNILDKKYKTGGFEQGRNSNYRTLSEDTENTTRIFGPKYWYGYGTTYYMNVYLRF